MKNFDAVITDEHLTEMVEVLADAEFSNLDALLTVVRIGVQVAIIAELEERQAKRKVATRAGDPPSR